MSGWKTTSPTPGTRHSQPERWTPRQQRDLVRRQEAEGSANPGHGPLPIDAARPARAGRDCLDYVAWVKRNGTRLPEGRGGNPELETWTCDTGYGLGWRDLAVSLHLGVAASSPRRTWQNQLAQNQDLLDRLAEYRVVVARLDRFGPHLWKETFPFNQKRIEITGG